MKRILPALLALALVGCENEAEKEKIRLEIDSLNSTVNELKIENDSLEKELRLLESRGPVNFPEEFDSIQNPEEFIVNTLKESPELIAEEPVLGGKMYFTDVRILNERFLWAQYEDGHIQGEAIFSYRLKSNNQMAYRFIAKLPEEN